jgi:hypothetical protein
MTLSAAMYVRSKQKMQLRKKAQILIRKREWQKLVVNLAVVYQEVKAEGKSSDYCYCKDIIELRFEQATNSNHTLIRQTNHLLLVTMLKEG